MKYLVIALLFLFSIKVVTAQNFQLDNVVVIAQQDKLPDRFSVEVALIQLFNYYNIHSEASLNIIKRGSSPSVLLSDSLQNKLKADGFDTYLLVSVRGFDRRFKPATEINSFEEELNFGHLFPIYREGASKVTFNFTFYQLDDSGKLSPAHYELIRTGSAGDDGEVIKELIKAVEKRLTKDWLE